MITDDELLNIELRNKGNADVERLILELRTTRYRTTQEYHTPSSAEAFKKSRGIK